MAANNRSIRQRLTVASAALVAGAGLLVLGLVYLVTVGAMRRDTDDAVQAELAAVMQYHDLLSFDTFNAEIRKRSREGRYEYLLVDRNGLPITGTLAHWPEDLEDVTGSIDGRSVPLVEQRGDETVTRWLHSAVREMPDGKRLLVARDISAQVSYEETLKIAVAGAGMLAIIVALAAGLTMSRNLLGRVESMNRTILSILAGRRTSRMPQSGRDDEFEELAHHFNTLLDRNDRLMEQVREVTNNIAHDLRSPLARMRVDLESALSTRRSVDEYQDTLHHVLEETDSILETFSALLSIAQIESGAVRGDMCEVELEPIVEDVAELYEPVAEEAGLVLRARVDAGATVLGNRRLIAQAVTNLVDNALKYGERSVEIRVRRAGSGSEISVADRGPGIPSSSHAAVLDRFVRLDASRNKPGTGLGLSFVSAVADLHEARLVLADNGPGLVATLRFPTLVPRPERSRARMERTVGVG